MPEQGLVKELAMLVGKGWFAVVIGVLLGVYGAVELVVRAKASGWVWIAIALAVMTIISLNVAYQALKERNVALAGGASDESKFSSHPRRRAQSPTTEVRLRKRSLNELNGQVGLLLELERELRQFGDVYVQRRCDALDRAPGRV